MQTFRKSTTPKRYTGLRDRFVPRSFSPWLADRRLVNAINERSAAFNEKSDQDLRDEIQRIRTESTKKQQPLHSDAMLWMSMAMAKQALLRTTSMDAYDVQILAGIAMSRGAIAEMQTGEGKTLTSMFPIVAHAIGGNGIHVATVNSYLTERDFEFLAPALRLLGLSVGIAKDGDSTDNKRKAYRCDVTFATGYELGFDFLRDQISLMSAGPERLGAALKRELFSLPDSRPVPSQRSHALAIIDEIDSVLIDEAITPLVLSAGSVLDKSNPETYYKAAEVAERLIIDEDYIVDATAKSLFLTNSGSRKIYGDTEPDPESIGSVRDLNRIESDLDQVQGMLNDLVRPWHQYVESALRAQHTMQRDVNYVVRDGKVEIVDEYTGRIFSDRNWRDGLHQAVEAKENVEISEEKRTLARISRQRYFQRYELISGMTGTVTGHEREMLKCYKLPIVVIPLRKQSQRKEIPTRYFATLQSKDLAIVEDVITRQETGQPILIGTRTIEQTRTLAKCLAERGIDHQVLNGVQDEDEATLIGKAGAAGSITIATNMAGRGTDIKLDQQAIQAGGLHVIGYERNRSKRIDRQLLGRAGRQGDPGSGQFFVSAEDEIVVRFDTSLQNSLSRLKGKRDGATNRNFDASIRQIQQKAEEEGLKQRESVMREELWLDEVKKAVGC